MGVPGPCGPCSEINYDRGPAYGAEGGPAVNDERYVEIWNLVFMQYERGAGDGKDDFPILGDLPAQNIDTGLGLERLAMILQDVHNMYEIDTSRMIIDKATELTGRRLRRRPRRSTSRCAWSPTTSAPPSCSSATASARATRAAATCCAASCAGRSATCGCWAPPCRPSANWSTPSSTR